MSRLSSTYKILEYYYAFQQFLVLTRPFAMKISGHIIYQDNLLRTLS